MILVVWGYKGGFESKISHLTLWGLDSSGMRVQIYIWQWEESFDFKMILLEWFEGATIHLRAKGVISIEENPTLMVWGRKCTFEREIVHLSSRRSYLRALSGQKDILEQNANLSWGGLDLTELQCKGTFWQLEVPFENEIHDLNELKVNGMFRGQEGSFDNLILVDWDAMAHLVTKKAHLGAKGHDLSGLRCKRGSFSRFELI